MRRTTNPFIEISPRRPPALDQNMSHMPATRGCRAGGAAERGRHTLEWIQQPLERSTSFAWVLRDIDSFGAGRRAENRSKCRSERAFASPHARQRLDRRCLSIVRVTRHHAVVGQPLVCRAAAVVSLYRYRSRPVSSDRRANHRNARLRARLRPDRRV